MSNPPGMRKRWMNCWRPISNRSGAWGFSGSSAALAQLPSQ